MKNYKDLDVYKKSYLLAIKMHDIASRLPHEYRFDLADQIRRASRSIPSNIAEGFTRSKSNKDTINFLKDSLGSNNEILFNIEFMRDVKMIDETLSRYLFDEYTVVGKQLFRLIESIIPPRTNN